MGAVTFLCVCGKPRAEFRLYCEACTIERAETAACNAIKRDQVSGRVRHDALRDLDIFGQPLKEGS